MDIVEEIAGPVAFPTDDEVDGFWSHDRMHAPRPLSPLAFELVAETLAMGFTRAHREFGAPVNMLARSVNSFLYTSFCPATDLDDLKERAERYVHLPAVLDEIGTRWALEWKPWLIETVRAGRVAEYRHLTNDQFAAELDRQRDHMLEQWTIHGRINFATVGAARFIDFYNATFNPSDATEAHQLLQGYETQTVRASQAMWQLSRLVRSSPVLVELFAMPTTDVVERLRYRAARTGDVVVFADAFEGFLDEFGWRSDAVFDVADVTWREDPSIPIDSLRGHVRLSDEHDPSLAFSAAVARREAQMHEARRKLADDPDALATFDRYHEAGRHNLPITEDHAFWIDQSGIANFRRFLLQLGERLVQDGCLDRTDDVFFLTRTEIGHALAHRGNHRVQSATRRTALAAAAAATPPRSIGTAPPPSPGELDPLVDAIANRIVGRRPPQHHDPEATVLTGHPASPGRVTGTARVVRSLADAAKLDDGDILVCEMTLPPWVPLFAVAAAVVADTGGLMSHCAIVAREFSLPAVVGTQFGTTLITDGMQITVDGGAGLVHLHRS